MYQIDGVGEETIYEAFEYLQTLFGKIASSHPLLGNPIYIGVTEEPKCRDNVATQ